MCELSMRLEWLTRDSESAADLESIGLDSIPTFHFESLVRKKLLQLARAEGSTSGDLMILPLALYADCVEVDKRVWDCCRQVADSNEDFQGAHSRLIKNARSYEQSLENVRACLGLGVLA